ncbi:MAG: DUF167 family protein [Gemmatimonadales bacterium]|jgi:uncharacterized protein (TIGR00251 family)
MVRIEAWGDGVCFEVRAQPRASRTEVAGAHGEAIKIRLAAPPVEGAANAELVAFLAKQLGVSKSAVRVIKGKRGRDKVVQVEGISRADVQALLR